MTIRFLDINDVYDFRELRIKGLQTDPTAFGSTYEREINLPLEKFEARLEHSPDQFTVGCFDRNKLICTASFIRHSADKFKHKGMIIAVYCEEEFRGSGAAKKTIQFLLTNAKKLPGLEILHITVVSDNIRAKRFYRNIGFQKYGQEPRALFYENRYYDEDLMYLEIQKG